MPPVGFFEPPPAPAPPPEPPRAPPPRRPATPPDLAVISGKGRARGVTPPYLPEAPSGEQGARGGRGFQRYAAERREERASGRPKYDVPYISHQWTFSDDGAVAVLDTYPQPEGPRGRPAFVTILAAAPAERRPVPDDLWCDWGQHGKTRVDVNLFGTRFENIGHPHFGGNVFEDLNNFVMRCDMPSGGSPGEVSLVSGDGRFRISRLTVEQPEPWPEEPAVNLRLCTSGVWGLGGARFITEYLEHARRMGFDGIEYYSFDASGTKVHRKVLEHYVRSGWMRLHDWSPCFGTDTPGHPWQSFESVGWSRLRNWQHGQILTRNDCYWRNRRRANYILITDIDELPWAPTPPHHIYPEVTQWAEAQYRRSQGRIVGFSLKNHVWPPHLSKETEGRPLLARLLYEQEREVCPYNCGKHHQGRWKWMLRTRDEADVPIVHSLWYHAITHTYVDAEYRYYNGTHLVDHMVLIPPERAKLRHMVSWKRMAAEGASYPDKGYVRSPLPESVVEDAQRRIRSDPPLAELYARQIAPEDLPEQCRASVRVGLGIFCQ
eukprot:TRINITY_DN1558_c1_g1_i1.p1 TRINITY_DN1558_c1_g1~~TRINITY_DN1558_c1_g1_i1.p1  ORF type:complete len:620 (+),score=151.65 TRINITY_DN1558_c1_g1_i1:219-1862(+)